MRHAASMPLMAALLSGCAERPQSLLTGPADVAPVAHLQGQVVDRRTGLSVPGAMVVVASSNDPTVAGAAYGATDLNGRFNLEAPSGDLRVRVLSIGYRPSSLHLPSSQLAGAPIRVSLEQAPIETSNCVFGVLDSAGPKAHSERAKP